MTSSIQVTEEMIDAGQRAWMDAGGHGCDSADLVGPIYLAMRSKDHSMTSSIQVSEELILFLNGEGPLEGRWFGDKVPLRWGQFWWRKYLPALKVVDEADHDEIDDVIARLEITDPEAARYLKATDRELAGEREENERLRVAMRSKDHSIAVDDAWFSDEMGERIIAAMEKAGAIGRRDDPVEIIRAALVRPIDAAQLIANCGFEKMSRPIADDVREALEETFLARLQLSDHQQQLDAGGVMVGVSRQALDEVLVAFEKLDAITAIGSQSIEGVHLYSGDKTRCGQWLNPDIERTVAVYEATCPACLNAYRSTLAKDEERHGSHD